MYKWILHIKSEDFENTVSTLAYKISNFHILLCPLFIFHQDIDSSE